MNSVNDRNRDIGDFVPAPDDDMLICRCEEITKGEIRQAVHDGMYEKALENMKNKTFVAKDLDEFCRVAEETPGFIKAMWCGDSACEDKIKDITGGVKSRCIPFEEENLGDACVCCGKKAKHMVYWGKQY